MLFKSFGLWWLIVFALSFIVCLILINRTWMKWVNNPVIVSFNQEQTPIWKIPFPSVTICPINRVNETHYNYTEKFQSAANLSEKEYKKFWDVQLICAIESFQVPSSRAINISDEDVDENLNDVNPKLEDMIFYVFWSDEPQEVDFFTSQMTEDGICFTSNSLGQKDMFTDNFHGWTMENGYSPTSGPKTYPRRTARDGAIGGLSVGLITKMKDINYMCGLAISGYKIIFHNPAEIARPRHQYILAPFGKKVTVAVTPQLTLTSVGLLTTPPHTRKCFFSHERQLKFFRIYTENNCRMECSVNITLYVCGCVPFYLPRGNDTPVCGYGSSECLRHTKRQLHRYDISPEKNAAKSEKLKVAFEIRDRCNCMPSCHSLSYTVDTSQTDTFTRKTVQLINGVQGGIDDDEIAELIMNGQATETFIEIFFKDTQFLALRRSELYGQTDFVANCGGLLGLFMGFSFLSLMEIIYFLTIRVWCKFKHRKIEHGGIITVHQ